MRHRRFDVIVIGAGTAGMVAGTRLAEEGADVCVLARGIGSTHLAPGTIDVLGYSPERVDSPLEGIAALADARPDHPYARLGAGAVARALEWLIATVARGALGDYRYVGSAQRNLLLPTAVGSLKPSALVPETLAAGDAGGLGRIAVVGPTPLRDFHPNLCAENLRGAGIDARPVRVEVEVDRADASVLGLARRSEEPAWRAALAARLLPLVRGVDQIALPAMLGVRDPHAVLEDLARRLGRPVFEIPTLPPSVPGMRLYAILERALRAAGGRLVVGAGVIAHRRDGERVVSVDTETAGSSTTYEAGVFVLATGGLHSGAIALDSHWRAHERTFDLPLAGVPEAGAPRFVPGYFDEQPLARLGVAVDDRLRATGAENVVVAGAALPGAAPWLEASGEGIALASGHQAAVVASELLGTRAAA